MRDFSPVAIGIAGAVIGGLIGGADTAMVGFAAGFLWRHMTRLTAEQDSLRGELTVLRETSDRLERAVRRLEGQINNATTSPPAQTSAPETVAARASVAPPPPVPSPAPRAVPVVPAERPASVAPDSLDSSIGAPVGPPRVTRPPFFWLIEFFTTGNVVAKAGMVVVFFGVAFLLRYAAERGMLPIEYRLIGAAVGAIAFLALGWRLRRSRRDYALVLQGGAVGVLYLTVFAAFRLYGLLPAPLTFGLLLAIVAFSGVLAVVQDALSLAVLGTSGGFLAPILASTGAGSHVALFSYYAVLNGGVLGIAWFRAWRFLNWLAFVFTFGIGFIWGAQFYQPAFFATTEPFLLLFFLLFVAVSILFATRPAEPGSGLADLRGYIDGSLVFGTPAIAFGMQSVLVRDIPFARAYSAVALAALYLILARTLWRRGQALRPLAEAFLALCVVFLILAVPLAFAGHATAVAWALEGSGLVWIGVRQRRLLARLAGSALLLGAGVAFAVMASTADSGIPVLNTRLLGGVAIAVGSLIAGRVLSRARASLRPGEPVLEWVLLVWGLLWWFGATLVEAERQVPSRYFLSAGLLTLAAGAALAGLLARRWQWRAMMLALMPSGPLIWMLVLPAFAIDGSAGPLADLGWLAWPAVLAASLVLVFWFESIWDARVVNAWHLGFMWLLIFLTTWAIEVVVRQIVPETATWSLTVWGVVPAVFVLALVSGAFPFWPVQRFRQLYAQYVPLVPTVAILLWVIWACGQRGESVPLPYVPFLNPLELAQAFGLLAAYAWWRRVAGSESGLAGSASGAGLPVLAAFAFLALNMVVGRVVHFYLGVPFDMDNLIDSSVFQAGISILWGVTAGALMATARLRLDRAVWMIGASLLAALVVKLFLIDLGNVGGVARIVSFLAAGLLILGIGYVAPAPPKAPKPV